MSVATTAQDVMTRMQEDLQRALQKPVEKRSWVMIIDARKCIGCQACVAACVVENVLPPGVTYRTVPEVEYAPPGKSVRNVFMPANCMQCANPPCVAAANKVAPGSFEQRPDGIIAIHYDKVRGGGRKAKGGRRKAQNLGLRVFQAAAKACPYKRALYYDNGDYYTDDTPGGPQQWESRPTSDYNREWDRKSVVNSPRKCHFCLHRISSGFLPACVTTCVGRAIFFGDANDPNSYVSEVLRTQANKVLRIKDWFGTEPRVYYLSDTPQECAAMHYPE